MHAQIKNIEDNMHSQIKNIEDLYVLKFLQIEPTTCYLFSNLSLDQILFYGLHCKKLLNMYNAYNNNHGTF